MRLREDVATRVARLYDYGSLSGVETHVASVTLKIPLFDGGKMDRIARRRFPFEIAKNGRLAALSDYERARIDLAEAMGTTPELRF